MGKGFSFVAGAVVGAAAGTIIGILVAPRSGSETRAMAADMANDAWDNARDMYEQGMDQARAAATDFGPMVDAKTDELRAKVDPRAHGSAARAAERRHRRRQRHTRCRRRRRVRRRRARS